MCSPEVDAEGGPSPCNDGSVDDLLRPRTAPRLLDERMAQPVQRLGNLLFRPPLHLGEDLLQLGLFASQPVGVRAGPEDARSGPGAAPTGPSPPGERESEREAESGAPACPGGVRLVVAGQQEVKAGAEGGHRDPAADEVGRIVGTGGGGVVVVGAAAPCALAGVQLRECEPEREPGRQRGRSAVPTATQPQGVRSNPPPPPAASPPALSPSPDGSDSAGVSVSVSVSGVPTSTVKAGVLSA